MNEPHYPFQEIADLTFEFESISEKKTIRKAISYQLIDKQNQVFNLALVDLYDDGSADDLSVNDNNDMVKILATIMRTINLFFDKNPDAVLQFKGSTPSRTRLYRIAISKVLVDAEQIYDIYGLTDKTIEKFQANQPYQGFVIVCKTKISV